MNDLQKELKELKAKVIDLQLRIYDEPVAKWQPKGGKWFIDATGDIIDYGSSNERIRPFGRERDTKEQALRASVEMRKFNRLLELRDELCGDEAVDWGNNATGFYLYFSYSLNRWAWSSDEQCESVQPYFTIQESAQRACDMLNSGEVVL